VTSRATWLTSGYLIAVSQAAESANASVSEMSVMRQRTTKVAALSI
jgi:hypothetical protein